LLALVVLVSSCAGGGSMVAPPAGFKRFEGSDFSFAYPQSWTIVQRATASAGQQVEIHSPRVAHGLFVKILLFRRVRPHSTIDGLTRFFTGSYPVVLPGSRTLSQSDVHVAGAQSGRRLVTEYPAQATPSQTVPARILDLFGVASPDLAIATG
jgi:hypothetical protein